MAGRKKNTDIFREKSLDRVSTPDDLDKYIRSTTPSLWLLLGAIVFMLVGVLIWASVGKLEVKRTVGCKVKNGIMTIYIRETDCEKISEDSYIEIEGRRYSSFTATGPFLVGEASDSFLVKAAELNDGEWYYTASCPTELDDGEYKGNAMLEKISPIKFILN